MSTRYEEAEELTDTQKELHSLADELEHLIESASTKDDDWYIINNLDGSVTHRPTELTFMYSNGNGVHKLHTAKMQGTGTYMDLSDLRESTATELGGILNKIHKRITEEDLKASLTDIIDMFKQVEQDNE